MPMPIRPAELDIHEIKATLRLYRHNSRTSIKERTEWRKAFVTTLPAAIEYIEALELYISELKGRV